MDTKVLLEHLTRIISAISKLVFAQKIKPLIDSEYFLEGSAFLSD